MAGWLGRLKVPREKKVTPLKKGGHLDRFLLWVKLEMIARFRVSAVENEPREFDFQKRRLGVVNRGDMGGSLVDKKDHGEDEQRRG